MGPAKLGPGETQLRQALLPPSLRRSWGKDLIVLLYIF